MDPLLTRDGQTCCLAVHFEKWRAPALHRHFLQQHGAEAPSLEEILTLGGELADAWQMGVSPRCYVCGAKVAKGGYCTCLTRRLPRNPGYAQAKRMVEGGMGDALAAQFSCQDCGMCGVMSAAQLERNGGKDYVLCQPCAKAVTVAAKEASEKAAAQAAKAAKANHDATAAALLAQAKAAAQAKVTAANAAYQGACSALKTAEATLRMRAELLQAASELATKTDALMQQSGFEASDIDAMTAPMRAKVAQAQADLGQAQRSREAALTRVEATKAFLAQAQAEVRA